MRALNIVFPKIKQLLRLRLENFLHFPLKLPNFLQNWQFAYKTKQLLSNFQAENSWDPKQLEAEVKNGVAYKKTNV